MSASSPCTAINSAIKAKGVSLQQLAASIGSSPERVDRIVTGKERPTQQELQSIASSLDIGKPPPHDSAHATK